MYVRRLIGISLVLLMGTTYALAASHFDGADSMIVITQQAAINVSAFTVGCMGSYSGPGEANLGRILEKTGAWILRMQIGTPNKLRFTATGWSTQGDWEIDMQASGVWAHWAVSYDASSTANVPVLYLNGVSGAGVIATPTGTFTTGTGDLVIGNNTGGTRTFAGELGECFVYNRVLSALEVMQVKVKGPTSLTRGRVGYWPMGVFGGRNYTSTTGLDGVETAITQVGPHPPLSYASQGNTP